MMATVVLNLSGLMNGVLQLFLRSNTATTSFGPNIGRSRATCEHEIRMWGANELAFNNHLVDPVSGPHTLTADAESRTDSRASLIRRMESLKSSPFRSPARSNTLASDDVEQTRVVPTVPEPTAESPSQLFARGHARTRSYSLFPTDPISPTKPLAASSNIKPETESLYGISQQVSPPSKKQETDSVYDISLLAPPQPVFALEERGPGHHRDSSVASSATVQIGLRISHALSPSQENILAHSFSSTTYNANAARPVSPPLKVQIQNLSKFDTLVRSPRRPSPLITSIKPPEQSLTRTARTNKTLPPTPNTAFTPALNGLSESSTTLSPAVYSPEKKTANSPNSASPLGRSPIVFPTRLERSNPSRQPVRESKADWI